MNYLELLRLAGPEVTVACAALVVLFWDLAGSPAQPPEHRWRRGAAVVITGCALAGLWSFLAPAHASVAQGVLVVDPLTQLVKQVLLSLAVFTALLSGNGKFTRHVGEYFALLLLATLGMMFLVSTEETLMMFVSLELTSLSLYILTGFDRRDARSAEAALKYFLFGSTAAAVMLFGLSLLYGLSGATSLREIASHWRGQGFDPLLALALVMIVVGFAFKIAVVPFHLWAPDTYEGAPTPAAALIASGSKVASFFMFAKVLMLGFAGVEGQGAWRHFAPGWTPLLAALAVGSMLLGNLGAIAQTQLKRLLAYSAIAHAGYVLLALLALAHEPSRSEGLAALLYYVATYGLTAVGAFGVVVALEPIHGDIRLTTLAGLSQRAPLLAVCLLVFMLSLAGLPPLAGFFGKFYVFTAAAAAGSPALGLLWLVVLAIVMSAVSLYYYLQVLKQAYVLPGPDGAPPVAVAFPVQLALSVLALGVVLLGAAPHLLLDRLQTVLRAAGY